MNSPHKRALAILLTVGLSAPACGPFFPDTVLDLPQAALRVRGTVMLDEMIALDRSHGRKLSMQAAGLEMIRRVCMNADFSRNNPISDQDYKIAQRRTALAPLIAAGMSEEMASQLKLGEGATLSEAIELAAILTRDKVAHTRVSEIISAFTTWRDSLPKANFDGPWDVSVPPQSAVAATPNFSEVPRDITAYWQAARMWRAGDAASARATWQSILDLPENDHRHRSVWAAWMLAKTSRGQADALPLYQKALALAESGHDDALNLKALSMGWLAMIETDPVAKLKGYFEAACSGDEDMLIDLRMQLTPVLNDPAAMERAVADTLIRELVTALIFIMRSDTNLPARNEDARESAWLSLLETHPAEKPSPAAAKAAWYCYSRADFNAARRWLRQAPADAGEVLWLRAKLALRDGKLDEAARFFTKAASCYQFAPSEQPAIPDMGGCDRWNKTGPRRDWMRGQFHADRAIVHIGRGEFLRAMDFLAAANYLDDAAYLAERVLTTDELVSWVKLHRPEPVTNPQIAVLSIDAKGRLIKRGEPMQCDRLRYLLARRLAREFRFREAAGFMPHELTQVFDHYVRLHRASRANTWPDETKANILWHLASIRRHSGLELFGYDGTPDSAAWDGDFEATNFLGRRSLKTGWHFSWEDAERSIKPPTHPEDIAFPPVTRDEIQRITPHIALNQARFHYRYDAADIARRAAGLLPDNDPRTLFILHEAGRWLAHRDPLAADRFYQEIIRRCPDLPLGRELDRRRWFLPEPPENPLPELPAELRFTDPNVTSIQKTPQKIAGQR